MGEKWLRILLNVATSTSLLDSFTCRKFTTWDRRLYFPSEGRRAEDFFARKIRRFRPGLNPRTWVPKASTLTSRPPKPLSYTTGFWKLLPSLFSVWSTFIWSSGPVPMFEKKPGVKLSWLSWIPSVPWHCIAVSFRLLHVPPSGILAWDFELCCMRSTRYKFYPSHGPTEL